MGVYLYTVGTTGRIKTEAGETVFPMAYRWKFYWGYNPSEAKHLARIYKAAQKAVGHADFSGLVFMSEKAEDGIDVYRLKPEITQWVDSGPVQGERVGRLQKVGRKWSIVPVEQMPTENELREFWNRKGVPNCGACCYSYRKNDGNKIYSQGIVNLDDAGNFVSCHMKFGEGVYEMTSETDSIGAHLVVRAKELTENYVGSRTIYFNGYYNDIVLRGNTTTRKAI
jgi:hypothetical protein